MANEKLGDVFDFSWGGTDICGDSHNLNASRVVTNVRTNCGNNVVAGANSYTLDLSGPLGFGTGSTEATLYTAMTTTTAQAWETDPDGTGTAATTNPLMSGSALAESFNISMGVGNPITFQFNAQGTDSGGIWARDVTP